MLARDKCVTGSERKGWNMSTNSQEVTSRAAVRAWRHRPVYFEAVEGATGATAAAI